MKNKLKCIKILSSQVLKCIIIISLVLCDFIVRSQTLSKQISTIEETVFTERSESLVKDYFSNLTTIGKLDEDQDIFIKNIVNTYFENEKVRVCNDLDITKSTQTDFDVATYLSNISLFFGNSEVDFSIKKLNLSKIYSSAENGSSSAFLFVKGQVTRVMTLTFNNKQRIDSTLLDIYIKFVPYKSNPRIYSIRNHEDNLNKFKLITVVPAGLNESLDNDNIMFVGKPKPIPNIKPGQFYLNSIPEGAIVEFIDYSDFGKRTTPATITLPATNYKIRLTKDEYEILDTIVNIGVDREKSFSLVPKFSFLNLNIKPENAEVSVNDKIMYFSNGINQRTEKGRKSIIISADNYYTQRFEINALAGKVQNINVSLVPKKGELSISARNQDAYQAFVYIDNVKIGNIPVNKFPIQQGSHAIRIEKSKFTSITKLVDISENHETKIDISLFSQVKVAISTEPTGAKISIDNKSIGISNLNTKLTVGSHVLKMEKDNYVTKSEIIIIKENDPSCKFSFSLTPSSYDIFINSKPKSADLYLNRKYQGTTPLNLRLPYGSHDLRFIHNGYLSKNLTIPVDKSMSIERRLFPSNFYILGADYGLDQVRLNLAWITNGILLGVGLQKNLNTNKAIKSADVKFENVSVNDKNLYNIEYGRIYNSDSLNLSLNAKIGFTIKEPFVFIITGGYSFIQTDKFQNVYKAKHDYISENSGTVINTGELFSEPKLTALGYTAFTAGLIIPIAQTVYLSADYYSNSDIGPGFAFGLGFMIK